ncbi:MAG: helix-turn-helix transcriptional regulator, partial [Chitinophagaceae bacterium]|nr:helix-turn-helix transcriptional regulator [Chitinophagaceae bacterium]
GGEDYQDILRKSRQEQGFSLFSESRSINPVQWDALRLLLDPPVADAIKPAYIRAKVEELTFLTLGSLDKKAPRSAIRPEEKEKFFEVKRFLDEHFLDELNLPQISRLFLLNQFKLKTGFRALFATTVFGYIQHKRMAFAKKMLEETSMSVGEIAAATGYESDTSFIRSFRIHYGISPGRLKANRFKSWGTPSV